MPERRSYLLHGAVWNVNGGHERAHYDRARKIDRQVVAIRFLRERLLDDNTFVVTVLGEELCYRFDCFMINLHAELEPLWLISVFGHRSTVLASPMFNFAVRPLTVAARPIKLCSMTADSIEAPSSTMTSLKIESRKTAPAPILANGPTTDRSRV